MTLDRAQREAVRDEIRTVSGDCGDISRSLDDGDRDFVVRRIALLMELVVVLDALGWTEPEAGPDGVDVEIHPQIAHWAAGAVVELEVSVGHGTPADWDKFGDALGALRLIAEAR